MKPNDLKASMRVRGRDGHIYRIGVALNGGPNYRTMYGITAQGERIAAVDRSFVWAARLQFGVKGYPEGFPIGAAVELRVSDLTALFDRVPA